ncbi:MULTISPECIES: hypothetical protein [unclassified Janthinobacterium]|uniref:hypothetical protein n=1 Tax=unclassified Janthinobacterium TaxID=2610881 RepID=UPI0013050935|nr:MULTISPECIES: hypothetical protein [unclassified Janthinobacterium]MBW3508671.1 hypothetical protein [Janthinobacterium sp. NKUCC06_STL]MDZ5632190.1 hypothetical protein [Janthinobacterium sp. GMG1]
MRATVAAPSLYEMQTASRNARAAGQVKSMVIGMLPRSGISLEQYLVAKVRAMETGEWQ